MDDDTAYMELVKANNQGELLALEIGIHALEMVGKAQGKKTKGDGLAGYASEIGKSSTSLKEWVGGANVYQSVRRMSDELNTKPSHLYEISKADSQHWQMLVDLLTRLLFELKKAGVKQNGKI